MSREALKAAQKHLETVGKGNNPNAADALEPADIDACGHLVHCVILILLCFSKPYGGSLLHTWEQEGNKLLFGDFTIKSTTDSHEYVEFNTERH